MKRHLFFAVLVLAILTAAPLFADLSIDLGVTALGSAVYSGESRPLGATAAVGATMFNGKALVQLNGSIFSPPLIDSAHTDPVAALGIGVLFSPVQYLYVGFRNGMMTPPDDVEGWISYGTMVLRVQNPGKGLHFFAESELSLIDTFNKFSMGVNLML